MTTAIDEVARLPAAGDNVAIATRRLEAGLELFDGERRYALGHTVLEGHRFAAAPIAAGEALRSWGLPFGTALRDIAPGEYVCNERILAVLPQRDVDFALPAAPNFADTFERYRFDEATIEPAEQVAPVASPGTFSGFVRGGGRGVGTRNFVVVIGLTSADASLAVAVAERLRADAGDAAEECEVVAVTHTEGGGRRRPHNLEFVQRALAGWIVHPNVGAVVVLDRGAGAYSNRDLETFLRANGYPLDAVEHAFVAAAGDFDAARDAAVAAAGPLLAAARRCTRSQAPLSALRIALQCGGSDAFSGISGNALAGWVSKELIRHGGGANLAETDELIGAEPYVLARVKDADVARRFVDKVATFEERAARHGASAEGNPSGGNNYRGLYNIALKSLGAARKKDPDVRLDGVLDYGQPMPGGGYWFMDSPGNDLESIAGQVATGCNLILFITGNGSITNFPFVPTLKFVTTTGRFVLMANEMDVNAGRYNDGEAMEDLGRETFELVRRVASGERTKGEAAGHSQVSLWREWRQEDASRLAELKARPRPSGEPVAARAAAPLDATFAAFDGPRGVHTQRVGLVMPTSLCSGQVAELIASELDARSDLGGGLRFVALAHTEGCGAANSEELYLQTLRGHLVHPFTQRALLLEHGCEKTHNDAVRHWLAERGESTEIYGFASVQLDGGLERVRDRVAAWFAERLVGQGAPTRATVGAEHMRLALLSRGDVPDGAAATLGELGARAVAAGALVVVPDNDALLRSDAFRRALLAAPGEPDRASLAYGQPAPVRGLHLMAAPTEDPSETITGLGGVGVELMIAAADGALQAHPMVPLLQVGATSGADLSSDASLDQLVARVVDVLSGEAAPRANAAGSVRFQLTRGDLGVSL